MFSIYERRRAHRLYSQIAVTCEIIDQKDNSVRKKTILTRNISPEGIYFEMDEILSLGTIINCSLRLPKSESIIYAAIRVVRVELLDEANKFGMGAVFVDLKSKDKDEIVNLVTSLDIRKLMELTIKGSGSDLHLLSGRTPFLRVHGEIEPLHWPVLVSEDIKTLLYSIMNKQQIKNFENDKELDFAIQFDLVNRFRINVHQQKGFVEAALRLINTKISSPEELNLPEIITELAKLKNGLIIIAGPTGSGKTTTIAAIVDYINKVRKSVIITLERPIEYVYPEGKCIIKQREVGIDTQSFSRALKSSLRQDPNVIVVGELDDVETIRTALIAAEAGYLVIASFHAPNTVQAIDRFIGMFAPGDRKQLLSQVSNCLQGVVTQLLIPKKGKEGRVLATEVLIVNGAVKRIIRNDELFQIPTVIQTGARYKMHSMYDSIKRAVNSGFVDEETANFYSEEFASHSNT